jgi:putative ATP-dependent endonuclease of the OLD family
LKGGQLSPGASRKAELFAFAAAQDAGDLLEVSVNDFSLESELTLAGNEWLLKEAYLKAHPRSECNWMSALANADREAKARAIQALFDNTPKGDFAQTLAEGLREAKDFNVPGYLRVAIEALVR